MHYIFTLYPQHCSLAALSSIMAMGFPHNSSPKTALRRLSPERSSVSPPQALPSKLLSRSSVLYAGHGLSPPRLSPDSSLIYAGHGLSPDSSPLKLSHALPSTTPSTQHAHALPCTRLSPVRGSPLELSHARLSRTLSPLRDASSPNSLHALPSTRQLSQLPRERCAALCSTCL